MNQPLRALLVALIAVLGFYSASDASAEPLPTVAFYPGCTYDSPLDAVPTDGSTTERRPPAIYYDVSTAAAVGQLSHALSSRSCATAVEPRTTHSAPPLPAHIGLGVVRTSGHAEMIDKSRSSLDRWQVAANGGDDLTRLYRAVDPAELKDIAGTSVYRSAPGGTEGKYFFPTKAQAENFSKPMDKTGTGPYCIHR